MLKKYKKIPLILTGLAGIALLTTGFSAWVIQGTNAAKQDNMVTISVGTLTDKRLTTTLSGLDQNVTFDSNVNGGTNRIKGTGDTEDMVFGGTVKVALSDTSSATITEVLTNVNFADNVLPYVIVDYVEGTYELTKRMIERGRKDIYLFSTVRHYFTNDLKEEGYIKAMQEAGLEPRIFRTSGDVAVSTPHFEEFFANHSIDGAISVRDSIAVNFMNVAIKNGRKIPEDISVAGLQNTKYALLSRPTLTCLYTPVYDIGVAAMSLLTKLMRQEEVESLHIVLKHTIINRESL